MHIHHGLRGLAYETVGLSSAVGERRKGSKRRAVLDI